MNSHSVIPGFSWPRKIMLALMFSFTGFFAYSLIQLGSVQPEGWFLSFLKGSKPLWGIWAFVGACLFLALCEVVMTRRRIKRRLAEINAQIADLANRGLAPRQYATPPVASTAQAPVASRMGWKRVLVEVMGWYGAAGLLSAYLLSSFGVMHPDQVLYQALNITAAIGIVIVSLSKKNYQPAVLDIIWAGVGIASLVKILW